MRIPPPLWKKGLGEEGFSMIVGLIIAVFLVGIMVSYSQWIRVRSTGGVQRLASQNALAYAESTVNLAMNSLRTPTIFGGGSTATIKVDNLERGRAEISLSRDLVNTNLVDATATGYYYLRAGNAVDNGQRAQIAVVQAKIRLSAANDYFAAVPGDLSILYGANAESGTIYARNLTFVGPGAGGGPPTRVGRALYSEKVYRCDPPNCTNKVQDSTPTFVVFTPPATSAEKLPAPPNLSTLGGGIGQYYYSNHTADAMPADFSGPIGEPSDGPPKVYYVNGDLVIGASGPLIVSGAYIIYVTGKITIRNNIQMATADTDTNWVAILAEGDITIAANPQAPANITLYGTYMTNGAFQGDASGGPKGTLTFVGGYVAHQGVYFAADSAGLPLFPIRSYTYQTSTSPNIVLPNFTSLIYYRVIQGKFSQ